MALNGTLPVRKLHPNAILPTYAHSGDAGLDLHAVEATKLLPHCWSKIATGIAIELPLGTEGQIRPRSGLAEKYGITVLNSPSTVDSGYRGELKVVLINHGPTAFDIDVGMRIAQLVVQQVLTMEPVWVDRLSETTRGDKGFGSSGP